MISPQEPAAEANSTYSWSPFGPYLYWAQRIGEDIAARIEAEATNPVPLTIDAAPGGANFYDGLLYAARLARLHHTDKGKR